MSYNISIFDAIVCIAYGGPVWFLSQSDISLVIKAFLRAKSFKIKMFVQTPEKKIRVEFFLETLQITLSICLGIVP